MIISLWTRLLDAVSPRTCAVCGGRLAVTEESVCSVCNYHLPRTGYHLHPYDNPMAKMFWGRMPVERATALFFYAPRSDASHLVYSLKYFNRPEIGFAMGRMMAGEIAGHGFFNGVDVVLPMPIARRRRGERGYNQSEEIAKGICSVVGLPMEMRAVERNRFNESQTHLHFWQRQENVEGAFSVGPKAASLAGRHVLIVDDIVTTGATIMACAEALRGIDGLRFSVLSLGLTKS